MGAAQPVPPSDARTYVTIRLDARPNGVLTLRQVRSWIASLPEEAVDVPLTPILRDTGTQRDPVVTLAGLTVTWEAPQ